MADVYLVFSWVGTLLFIAALMPQGYRTWRRGRAEDVSILFLLTVIAASVAMGVYAVGLANWVMLAGFVSNVLVWGYVLKVRLRPRPEAQS